MQRDQNIQRLSRETFDLCIIGGGASGAGCALDAALRGMKVALVEKTDFAAQTSSKSTKLVHGGVRYLEQAFKKLDLAQLRQVRHGLEERHIVLENAPHLAHRIGLITPVFSWIEGLYYYIGLTLYDLFAARKDHLPKSSWLSRKATLRRMPGINKKIHSSVLYYDGQLDDARYCMTLVKSAAEAGAVVANHVELIDFEHDTSGKIQSAHLRDLTTPDAPAMNIQARIFLNCCGPQSDRVRLLANPALSSRINPAKGIHIILPHEILESHYAMLVPKTKDGRVIFAVPFEGKLLVGTTDTPYDKLDEEPLAEAAEVRYLCETLQPFVSKSLENCAILAGFGGLRPLVSPHPGKKSKSTKTLLRDHEIEFDEHSGLVSLMGGKWTTYRLMAKDTIDFICRRQDIQSECRTEKHKLCGAKGWTRDFWKKLQQKYPLDEAICQHLANKYGTRAQEVLGLTESRPELRERIIAPYPFILAEIVYAAEQEMALDIRDFLARRIRLEILDWEAAQKAAPAVSKWMGATLGWPEAKIEAETRQYQSLIAQFEHISGLKI